MKKNSSINDNSLRAFITLKEVLFADGWYPQEIEGDNVFWARYSSEAGMLKCYFQIITELEQFIFRAIPENSSFKVPKDRLITVAEYITRANSGLRIGNLELDFSNRQICYKSSINFASEELTPKLIRNVIDPALEAIDTYLPYIPNIIDKTKTPIRAVTAIEYTV